MAHSAISIELGSWEALREIATPIRFAVFVQEQNVPADIELDDGDSKSLHAIARDASGTAVGTGRLLPDGHIGRMAVLAAARGTGVGTALLRALMNAARERGMRNIELSAQTHAVLFYMREGFTAYGEAYLDANIEHRMMRRAL